MYEVDDETFLAWFAGLYEGEGSVVVTKPQKYGARYLRLSLGSTDKDVLDRLVERIGGGLTFSSRSRANPKHKDFWLWQFARTEEVRKLGESLLPFLGERRRRDMVAALNAARLVPQPRLSPEERFWNLVDTSGDCWLWTGHVDAFGFGTWAMTTKTRKQAHRYCYGLGGDPVPPRLKNKCGNKHCVRPEHWEKDGR